MKPLSNPKLKHFFSILICRLGAKRIKDLEPTIHKIFGFIKYRLSDSIKLVVSHLPEFTQSFSLRFQEDFQVLLLSSFHSETHIVQMCYCGRENAFSSTHFKLSHLHSNAFHIFTLDLYLNQVNCLYIASRFTLFKKLVQLHIHIILLRAKESEFPYIAFLFIV